MSYSDVDESEKELLRTVARNIRKNPRQYDQNTFGTNECGSACCIAGHILLVAGWTPSRDGSGTYISSKGQRDYASHAARMQFGPHIRDVISEYTLFADEDSIDWPGEYKERFEDDSDPRERAKVAADLLEAIADGKVR